MPTVAELTTPLRREANRIVIKDRLDAAMMARLDLVVAHSRIAWQDGLGAATITPDQPIRLDEPILSLDGVQTHLDTLDVTPTRTAVRQACERLNVPTQFATGRLLPSHGDLAAGILNTLQTREDRPVMARLLKASDGWVMRALLSDRYGVIDNVDLLSAVIDGMGAANVDLGGCEIDADLTDDKFRLRIAVPQIAVAIPDLLGDYRPPFSLLPGRDVHAPADRGETPPVLWAGIEVTNSETGGGALRVQPRAVVLVCRNGLTRAIDTFRKVHTTGKLEQGIVDWSEATRRNSLALTASQIADAVRSFCSPAYLGAIVADMRRAKGVAVTDTVAAVEAVVKAVGLTQDEGKRVLDLFARSGDHTVLGLGQAVTAAAQAADDGDRQADMESAFWRVVESPAAFAGA